MCTTNRLPSDLNRQARVDFRTIVRVARIADVQIMKTVGLLAIHDIGVECGLPSLGDDLRGVRGILVLLALLSSANSNVPLGATVGSVECSASRIFSCRT